MKPMSNFEAYKNIGAYNASMLKNFLEGEKTGIWKRENPKEDTKAIINGRFFHDKIDGFLKKDKNLLSEYAILEIMETEVFGTEINRRKKEYQGWKKSIEGLTFVDENINAAADSLLDSDVFRILTEDGGQPEFNLVADYNEEIKLKGRLDYLPAFMPVIIDWKTIAKLPNVKNVEYAIRDYNYKFSAAFYSYLCFKNFGEWYDFLFVFVQSTAPYDIGLYTIPAYKLEPYFYEVIEPIILVAHELITKKRKPKFLHEQYIHDNNLLGSFYEKSF